MTAAAAAAAAANPDPYVEVLTVDQLFVDPAYQRDLDERRVERMADAYDSKLVGVLEVSDRGDSRFAIIDGQYRWATVRRARGPITPVPCRVHTGLSVEDEARLFYEIDRGRKPLNGWDRWKARRSAGDDEVVNGIEAVVASHGLQVNQAPQDGCISATVALEKVWALGGRDLLDLTLSTARAGFGRVRDAFDGVLLQGLATVLHVYDGEIELDRFVAQLETVTPRQVKARANGLKEAHQAQLPRLVAAVLVERYNAGPGRKVEPMLTRAPAGAKRGGMAPSGRAVSENVRIRDWARDRGLSVPANGTVPDDLREAYNRFRGGQQAAAAAGASTTRPSTPTSRATAATLTPATTASAPSTNGQQPGEQPDMTPTCHCGHTASRHPREHAGMCASPHCECITYRPAPAKAAV